MAGSVRSARAGASGSKVFDAPRRTVDSFLDLSAIPFLTAFDQRRPIPMQDDDQDRSIVLGRRQILRSAAGFGVLGLGLKAVGHAAPFATSALSAAACSDLAGDLAPFVTDPRFQAMCVLTPSQVEGPYYLNLNLVRADITEGKPGIATKLRVFVVRASDCTPVANAAVDVWHNEALGAYSGFANQGTAGQTFLRGIQFTDAAGLASFDSIYPGWYQGRTTHVHVKIKPVGAPVLTTQMYFVQSISDRVYTRPPYSTHGPSTTKNNQDGLFLPETVMNLIEVSNATLHFELVIGIP